MRLSVLDQSPVIGGHAPSQAMRETIRPGAGDRSAGLSPLPALVAGAGAFGLKAPGGRAAASAR